jgi:hypothetical protein
VLEHYQVSLTRCKAHKLLESRTQRVEQISSHNSSLLQGQNAHLFHTRNNPLTLYLISKLGNLFDARQKGSAVKQAPEYRLKGSKYTLHLFQMHR